MTYLLKVMYGQPDLGLSIVHAAQVAPGHGKTRVRLYGLHVTRLHREQQQTPDDTGEQSTAPFPGSTTKEKFTLAQQTLAITSREVPQPSLPTAPAWSAQTS